MRPCRRQRPPRSTARVASIPPWAPAESARAGRRHRRRPPLARQASSRSSASPEWPGRPAADRANRAGDAALPRLDLLGADYRFDVLALMAVAQLAPAIPCRRGGLERSHEIGRRLDFALLGIEVETNVKRLTALEAGRLAIAPAERGSRRTAHRRDGAPVGVAVQRHFDRGSDPAEDLFGIERQRNETHRSITDDGGLEGLRDHRGLLASNGPSSECPGTVIRAISAGARRPTSKARRVRLAVFEREATPLVGMPRPGLMR